MKACDELLNRKSYAKETTRMNKGDISEERGLKLKVQFFKMDGRTERLICAQEQAEEVFNPAEKS